MVTELQGILEERGKRYGSFIDHAYTTQDIKNNLARGASWWRCGCPQREALDMIAHKLGRIVNGDPNYADSWRDIAGYAMLIVNQLTTEAPCAGQAPSAGSF